MIDLVEQTFHRPEASRRPSSRQLLGDVMGDRAPTAATIRAIEDLCPGFGIQFSHTHRRRTEVVEMRTRCIL
jgi:hypothetical protein